MTETVVIDISRLQCSTRMEKATAVTLIFAILGSIFVANKDYDSDTDFVTRHFQGKAALQANPTPLEATKAAKSPTVSNTSPVAPVK